MVMTLSSDWDEIISELIHASWLRRYNEMVGRYVLHFYLECFLVHCDKAQTINTS